MKILITSGIFPPDIGGPASYVPKIATELSIRGHKVTVLCLSEQDFDDSKFNFDVIRINRRIFLPVRILLTITKIISLSVKSDLIFANTLTFEASMAAIISKKPIVHKVVADYAWEKLCELNLYHDTFEQYQKVKKTFTYCFFEYYFKFPLNFSTKIITPSNYLKNFITKWNKKLDIETIHNSFEFNGKFDKRQINESIKLVTVGRLEPVKGLTELIDKIKGSKYNLSLDIIGEGSQFEDLKILLKANKNIRLMGHMDHATVMKKLKYYDIFILNSYHEGLPNVLLEATNAGLYLVAQNVGGCSEVIDHNINGFLLDRSSKNRELDDAVKYFMEHNQEDRFDYIQKYIKPKFDFQKMVNETEEILISVV